jgi:hypothetical protein
MGASQKKYTMTMTARKCPLSSSVSASTDATSFSQVLAIKELSRVNGNLHSLLPAKMMSKFPPKTNVAGREIKNGGMVMWSQKHARVRRPSRSLHPPATTLTTLSQGLRRQAADAMLWSIERNNASFHNYLHI